MTWSPVSCSQIVASDEDSGQGKNSPAYLHAGHDQDLLPSSYRGTRDPVTFQNTQGTYRLTVRNTRNFSISEPSTGRTLATPRQPLSAAWRSTGRRRATSTATADFDWFEVHLEVGHTYQIDVEGVRHRLRHACRPRNYGQSIRLHSTEHPDCSQVPNPRPTVTEAENKNARDQLHPTRRSGRQGPIYISVTWRGRHRGYLPAEGAGGGTGSGLRQGPCPWKGACSRAAR